MPTHNIILGQKVRPEIIEVAKYLRANQTPIEQALWECLRNHRLNGWKFRRQQILDRTIVDFYCHKAGLVIELDGSYHADVDQQTYDRERDQMLMAHGLRILRFTNARIQDNLETVLIEIETACENPPNS